MRPEPRRAWLAFGAVSLWLFACYAHFLSPAFPANDSPETITAAAQLGLQHPPGYPLHTLLGRLAVAAPLPGSPAFHVSMLSAFLGVVCCLGLGVFVWGLAQQISTRLALPAGLAAMLWLGHSPVLWQQATEAKGGVYLLNLALTLGLLLCLLKAAQGRESAGSTKPWVRLFGLLAGLGLAHHWMSFAAALLVLVPLLIWVTRVWRSRGLLLQAGAFMGLGLTLYGVLVLRAGAGSDCSIGQPNHWGDFWWVVLRSGYQADPALLNSAWRQRHFDHYSLWLVKACTVFFLPGMLLGVWQLFKAGPLHRLMGLAASLLFAVFSVLVVWVNPTPVGDEFLIELFALPGFAAGLGLAVLGFVLSLHRSFSGDGWKILAFSPALLSFWAAAEGLQARRWDLGAYDFGRAILASAPKQGLLLAQDDFHIMPLYYLRGVEQRRRDVLPVVTTLLNYPWQQQQISRQRPDLDLAQGGNVHQVAREVILRNAVRLPVLSAPNQPGVDMSGMELVQQGLLKQVRLPQASTGIRQAAVLKSIPFRMRAGAYAKQELLTQRVLPYYAVAWVGWGNQCAAQGRIAEAAEAYRTCLGLGLPCPQSQVWHNLGLAYHRLGSNVEAIQCFEKALVLEPEQEVSAQALHVLKAGR
jgi:tetratricopeptide (TPR) repeat protein